MPIWDAKHLRLAVKAAEVALWSWNVDTDKLYIDDLGRELWGLPNKAKLTFEDLSARVDPPDRDRVRAAFQAARAIMGSFETDFRVVIDDDVRWISVRGQGDDSSMVNRFMFGG